MVWNKTPEDKVKQIIEQVKTTDKLALEIAKEFNVSEWLVGELTRKHLTTKERRELWARRARKSKVGEENPMYGRKGFLHHNSIEVTRCMGYRTVFKPEWWTGATKQHRIYEHVYVYCKENGMTELPKGHVIHHIDGNIDNNHISNLQILTISEHVKLHWKQRKEQRLSERSRE